MRGMFAEFDRIQLAEIGGKQRVPQGIVYICTYVHGCVSMYVLC